MDVTRRALILAGGGSKVAFQAGVLQVWLDEAHVEFERADAASGGLLNVVQWCEGRTGTRIADAWREMRPVRNVDPNWRELVRGPYADSLFRLDRFRAQIRDVWALDWTRIRAQTERPATCNVFDFTSQELRVVPHSEMTEDLLIAGISLPGWFPPVVIDGHAWVDAVYATDANLEAAIANGAEELWIVWTVSERGTWRHGPIAQYFQTIEAAANSRLRDVCHRIERSNRAIAEHRPGEFDHHVECRMLRREVPLHYLFAFGHDRMAEVVELGVATARRWCDANHVRRDMPCRRTPAASGRPVTVHFVERAAGRIAFGSGNGESDAHVDVAQRGALSMWLVMTVEDVERFVHDPEHLGHSKGWVRADVLGGRGPWSVENGSSFRLMVEDRDRPDEPEHQLMLYHLHLRNGREERTLVARKTCDAPDDGDGFRQRLAKLWHDTTRFDVAVYPRRVSSEGARAMQPCARGEMSLTLVDFARQLTTYRTDAHGIRAAVTSIARFDRMFLGHLWDVYLGNVLSSSPF